MLRTLVSILCGIVLGAMLDQPIKTVKQAVWDYGCGTQTALEQAGRVRKDAVRLEIAAVERGSASASLRLDLRTRHRDANELFERAANCGSALALANLGFSYCMGFGLPIDREKGLELIREASRRDHAVAIEWLARANYCPVFPKRDLASAE